MIKLEVENLSFLGRGPYNFNIPEGQILGIFGPSGAGKSLLLRAIADLDPHEGRVALEDNSYLDFSPANWRRKVAYLPAESRWWAETVAEHFTADTNLENLFKRGGLEKNCMEFSVSRLSTGEKQRLAILRLLALKPETLLLDEPTANLDRKNVEIYEDLLISHISENKASAIWVSHDQEQLKRVAARICFMEQGGKLGDMK